MVAAEGEGGHGWAGMDEGGGGWGEEAAAEAGGGGAAPPPHRDVVCCVAGLSGQVAPVAVLANLLAVPAVAPATVLGVLAALVSTVAVPLASSTAITSHAIVPDSGRWSLVENSALTMGGLSRKSHSRPSESTKRASTQPGNGSLETQRTTSQRRSGT